MFTIYEGNPSILQCKADSRSISRNIFFFFLKRSFFQIMGQATLRNKIKIFAFKPFCYSDRRWLDTEENPSKYSVSIQCIYLPTRWVIESTNERIVFHLAGKEDLKKRPTRVSWIKK